ncbi:hypothetical protein TSUD_91920 [Trifolium subterraneum]|uniref:Uncharacterized protein n=1 Tax=Trifolium subterraneum TaxID=3900 RepID=A0A2Z6PHI0_TRISU|nr:hypothetical protein TSUD_91920 [Trifolium subterraneum]
MEKKIWYSSCMVQLIVNIFKFCERGFLSRFKDLHGYCTSTSVKLTINAFLRKKPGGTWDPPRSDYHQNKKRHLEFPTSKTIIVSDSYGGGGRPSVELPRKKRVLVMGRIRLPSAGLGGIARCKSPDSSYVLA